MKPTFIGIGAQKAATSWLHGVLGNHPDVFVSEPKELDFFSYYFDRGYEWYERFFADGADKLHRGETSPSYLYNPTVAARARAYAPDLKVIAILRDPVSRAFSNHLHEIRKGHLRGSELFEDGLANNPCYVEQGLYAKHLSVWFDVFPREQILVLLSEEIDKDPATQLDKVYAFLGVRALAPDEAALGRAHESVGVRNEAVGALLRNTRQAIRRAGFGGALRRVKRLPGVDTVLRLNRRDLRREIPPMEASTRKALQATFASDTLRLPALIGRPDLPWPTYAAAASARPEGGEPAR